MPTSLTEYNFIEKIRVACKVFATLLLVSCSVNLYAHPPSGSSDFQKVPIATDLANAVDFEIADDGRIFILNRYGELLVYSPTTQNTVVGATFNVYTGVEAGLIGIAFDPGFASNQFVYLYYSPPSPSVNRLSRFTMLGNQLQPSSEVILLEVPVNRQQGHHDGGNLEFDNFGNLYIGTGDDTFPSNYAPLDETDHRKSAEKSSANSMDLRGKILRIRPLPGGGYSIPSGNLFTELSQGLPEIYVMGARNPYKFSIDPATNWLFWGDIGPDANLDGPEGPSGKDEINLTKESGNFGWPHFIGPNLPYLNTYLNYYFDPAAPTNDSIWNTGPRLLPPAEGAWITVARASYMAGPVYHFDDQNLNPNRLPESFDNHFFYWDFNTSRVWFVEFDENGQLLINEEWTELAEPGRGYIDFEIGPDDQLYVLEYGTGCCALDVGNGTLHRVDFVGEHGNRSPVVSMTATPRSGSLPLEVSFSSVGSFDPDGDPISYRWDFESDGIDDAFTPDAVHTYQTPGIVNAQLVVSDPLGAESFGNVAIHAGNNIAEVDFVAPLEGSLFEWNEFVDVEVSVTDEEDGSISGGGIQCSEVEVQSALGHLEHAHDSTLISNCTGQIQFFSDHNTNGEDQLYYQLQARYTDQDNLASFKVIKLFPKQFAAEFNDESGGTELIANTDNQFASVNAIRATDTQSFIVFENRDLVGIDGVSYRVASDSNTAEIQLRLDSVDGPLVKTVPIPNSGGASNWIDAASNFVPPNGLHDLFFVFVGTPGLAGLLDINSVSFSGPGASYPAPPELTSITIGPSSTTVSEGETQQFTASGQDQYGDPFATNVTWTVSGGGTINGNGLFSATTAGGPFTVTASDGGLSGNASVTVTDSTPQNLALNQPTQSSSNKNASLTASNAVDGVASTRWSSQVSDPQWIYVDLGSVYAISRVVLNWHAAFGKTYEIQVSDDALSWTTVFTEPNGNGGVDDITFSPASGRYVRMYGTQRGTRREYSLFEFEVYGSGETDPPELTSINIGPSSATVTEGETQQFTASGQDQYGDPFATNVSWTVSGGGTINGNGLFSATTAGGPFTVTASDGGISGNASVTVNAAADPPELTSITIGPSSATVTEGETQQFTASGQDQYGDPFATNVAWSVSGGGTINGNGLFSATTAGGPFTVTATDSGISGNASVTVNAATDPPELTSITIGPSSATVTEGETQQFTASGQDQYGDPFATNVTWSVSGGGTINGNGLFSATTAGGPFTVTASDSGISGSASVTVTDSTPPSDQNLALNQPTQSSSNENNSLTANNAVDGVAGTRWASQFSDPQWIYVDLGSVYAISRVVLKWESAFGKTYEIQVSDDTLSWTTVFTEPNGNGGVDDITFSPASGRYVRMYGTQRSTGWGYSLFEFEVYGSGETDPPELTSITIGPSSATVTEGETQQFTASGQDQYGDPFATNVTWSVSGGGTINGNGLFSATTAGGPFTVTASDSGISGNASVTVNAATDPPELTSITIGPSSTTVTEGETQQFTASGQDQYGDPFATNVTWSVSGGGTINGNGLFSATTAGGPFTVTASDGGLSGNASVTVTDSTPPSDQNLALNQPTQSSSNENNSLTANNAVDGVAGTRWASQFSDPQWIYVDLGSVYAISRVVLKWESAFGKTYEIQVSDDALSWTTVFTEPNGNGGVDDITFSPASGRYVRMYGTQRGTAWGYSLFEFEVYGSGETDPPELTSINIGPSSATVTEGETQQFTASGQDQYGDPFATNVSWTVSGGGTINGNGLFSATTAGGPFTVTASDSGISGNASVTVNAATDPSELTSITIGPSSATVTVGETQQFTASGQDQYGDPFATNVTWSVSGGGTINGNGLFSAATAGGPFTVTASDGGLSGNASVTVTDSTPPSDQNLALNQPTQSSSNENNSLTANNAVDGVAGTRWASQFSDPQWIYVDLGSVYAISRVVLKWESAFGKTYEIQVSDDAMSWTTVFTEPNGNGGVDDITFSPASGRYVRMYGTQRGTAWGYSLFEFEVYGSGATPSWQTLPDSSQQRHESSLAVIGNRIVLLGGRGSRPVEIFDLQTGEWNTFSAPPITLHHFQAVTLEGLVYVIGAYTGRYPNEISVPNVYTYDPTLDQWNQGTLIPADRRRGSAGAVVHNNKIYIVGGIVGGHGEHADAKPWLDQYDPATNQWTILPDMPTARDHFGAAAVSGKIYAVAGRDSGISDSLDHTIGATSVYDIETLSWVELPVDSDIPTERAGVAVAANNGEIIVSGGEGFGQAWATVEAFDTNTSTWTTLPSMPTARHGMGAVVVGGEYYVSSGATSQGGGSQSTIFQKLPLGN